MPEFHLYRAYLPPGLSQTRPAGPPVPLLQVLTAPDICITIMAEIGENEADYMNSRTTHFFFLDRVGWKAVWRLARIIANAHRPSLTALLHEGQRHGFIVETNFSHVELEAV